MNKHLPATVGLTTIVSLVLTGCQSLPSVQALTIAVTATNHDPSGSVEAFEQVVIDHAENAMIPGDGKITVLTPSQVQTFDLTPMRGKYVESVPAKRATQITQSVGELEEFLNRAEATTDGLDVIGVLDRALEQTPGGGHLIFESSGFSTIAPLDLNAAGDWIGNPEALVGAANVTDLPDATGKHITFVGLGYPNPESDQEPAGPASRSALTTIMLGLCAKMGAVTCNTIAGPASPEPAIARNKVGSVNLNQITTHCVGQINIDTSLAFKPNSAMILDKADKVLKPIASALAKCPAGSTINAIGYSAKLPGESPSGGELLERKRAQAVLTRLAELGTPSRNIGAATAGGQLVDNLPNGIFNERLAVKNRAVVLSTE